MSGRLVEIEIGARPVAYTVPLDDLLGDDISDDATIEQLAEALRKWHRSAYSFMRDVGLDVELERCRMALAEIGVDPDIVRPAEGGSVFLPVVGITTETAWMASVTIQWPESTICWPCFDAASASAQAVWPDIDLQHDIVDSAWDACRADRPFQRVSCGATQ